MLLLTVMLVKTCIVPVVYLDYQLRKDFIIASYCVNKNRPQLHCDGKCYLAKKIEQARKQEERQAENDFLSKLLSAQTPITDFTFRLQFDQPYVSTTDHITFAFHNALKGQNFVLDFFHPPLC
ncbi:hypothetical protein FEN17_10185 [Dyadobacter luticola]|uniref:Uncharacterized protein n=1 Tax=Dyadobacter luticola TaxID=1979387 RepID=A0A5R9L658_9BACT|nr:hypothetical protein FEN17_10185 [Dyadobacter luticola]